MYTIFNDILEYLTNKCNELGRIPNRNEINNDKNIPSSDTIRKIFLKNKEKSYIEYFKEQGFPKSDEFKRRVENSFDFNIIKKNLIKYSNTLGRIPTMLEIDNEKSLPTSNQLKKLFLRIQKQNYIDFLIEMGFKMKFNNRKINIEFKSICEILLELCKKYKHIPTREQINNHAILPCADTLREIFNQNWFSGYVEYLGKFGYSQKTERNGRPRHIDYNDLCKIWENYYEINNVYPNSQTCISDNYLPTWNTVREICDDRFEEFYEKYGNGKNKKIKTYEEYCKLFKQISNQNEKPLTTSELINNEYGLPTSRWFIENCPDESVKDYNEFINYLGLKPNYHISKEFTVKQILKKSNEVNRPLKISDFYSPEGEEIGITTIKNHWGTFNNMLKDLGLPITQESMTERHRDIDTLKEDINRLCEQIFINEGRKNISRDDINNCEWCLNVQAYDRWFKKELNITVGEYIESLGFIPNKAGMGMLYEFEDGEITKSKFEYDTSMFLRKNNYIYNNTYIRDIRYKDFINEYSGNMDCDYIIKTNELTWYVEIAGMLDYSKIGKNNDDKIRRRYKEHLNKKMKMLQENSLNYKIIYPKDFKTKSMNEIFSFLNQ